MMDNIFEVWVEGRIKGSNLSWDDALAMVRYEARWADIVDLRTEQIVWKNHGRQD
jgi:hypothetical protein